MSIFNLKTAALAIVAGVGLSGCAYGPYGGLGVGVGYGNGYGYDYGNRYYGGYPLRLRRRLRYGYGYGYGSPYGWNDDYYYPGTGYYVYDRYRARIAGATPSGVTGRRQPAHRDSTSARPAQIIQNWADFQNGPQASNVVRQRNVTTDRQLSARGQMRARANAVQTVQQQERSAARAEARNERRAKRDEQPRAATIRTKRVSRGV